MNETFNTCLQTHLIFSEFSSTLAQINISFSQDHMGISSSNTLWSKCTELTSTTSLALQTELLLV